MVRFALGVLVVALATATSCILSREGGLPVETTGATGGGTSLGGGGSSSGTTGGAGGLGGGPSCGLGFECVPEPEGGRLVRLVTEPFGACPAGWEDASSLYDGNSPACGACGCQPATGGSCAPGAVRRFENSDCTDQMGQSVTSSHEDCISVQMQDQDQADSYRLEPSTATGGSCEPMDLPTPPLVLVVVCGVEHPIVGACSNDGICVPSGSAETGSVCVQLEGSGPCPTAYPNPTTLYETADDTRECACACGSVSGACAGGHLDLRDHQGCGGALLATVPADGVCHDVSGVNGHDSYEVFGGTWSGSCAPSDAHTGDVSWGGEQTLCCP